MSKINIKINGESFETEQGQMIIEVADQHNIPIPRFCYHKKLSIAANCRMCLVDVANAPKSLPACATPVAEGMEISTQSAKAMESQKAVMEFLLINHPLDCPICDQGGECELQDVAMDYGSDISRYNQGKRAVKDKNIGPLIATEMTRCIHCTRCVRFGVEVAGMPELGATGRGEHMEIGTFIASSVDSELSGNMIDLCPVGALTSKPYRFTARPWELQQSPSIAPHDGVGSHIHIHLLRQKVMRVLPREAESINQTWISDRDRFSYEAIYSEDRITTPQIKINDQWHPVEWSVALETLTSRLKTVIADKGVDQVGALMSPSATLEEHYLLQKYLRDFGCQNMDHRLTQLDFSDQSGEPQAPTLGIKIEDLENIDHGLLIGSNLRKDVPLLNHRLRRATRRGGQISVINPVRYDFNYKLANQDIIDYRLMPSYLAGVYRALTEDNASLPENLRTLVANTQPTDKQRAIAAQLKAGEKTIVLLGTLALNHPQASVIKYFASAIAKLSNSAYGVVPMGANAAGAWIAGTVPHRGPAGMVSAKKGKSTVEMLRQPLAAYFLLNVEPELDCAESAQALKAMQSAALVVALTSFKSKAVEEYADILLPIATFAETSGTYINAEGQWQSFKGVVAPQGEARPAWKVLRVMANLMGLKEFEYESSEDVLKELKNKSTKNTFSVSKETIAYPKCATTVDTGAVNLVAERSLYAVDVLVRRSPALQKTSDANETVLRVNSELAERLKLKADQTAKVSLAGQSRELNWRKDDSLLANTVLMQVGVTETAGFMNTAETLSIE